MPRCAQALLDGLDDMGTTEVGAAHLGGQEDLLPPAGPLGEGLADGLLGAAVGLGGVDQRDAVVEGVMDGADGLSLVDGAHAPADGPGAEADHRHGRSVLPQGARLE